MTSSYFGKKCLDIFVKPDWNLKFGIWKAIKKLLRLLNTRNIKKYQEIQETSQQKGFSRRDERRILTV